MNDLTCHPGERLLDLVRGLKVRFGRERSFRLAASSLLSDRFLVSVSKTSLGPDAPQRILELCAALEIPADAAAPVREMLADAGFVHLGFERNAAGWLYKIYLEAPPPRNPTGPVVLHRAFKWDPRHPGRCVLTTYIWHPGLSTGQIQTRLAATYEATGPSPSFDIAAGILRLAAGRMKGSVRYMEVSEEANARRSFDLNLYDAGLRLADLLPFLGRMCAHYAIRPDDFFAFCSPLQDKLFGHLAGGIHREGRDFFTIYFGVESCS